MDEHQVMPTPADTVPVVVAHRGDAARFPENSIAALCGAADCGVAHLEFDVQLTADRVPVLLHDESLLRTAGLDQLVTASVAADIGQLSVGQPDRFGQTYWRECLPTLAGALAALAAKNLTIFVELKRHSLRAFGRHRVLDAVLPVLSESSQDIVLISFDRLVLEYARTRSHYPIGWVLSSYDEQAIRQIVQLSPDYVFCNRERLPGAGTPLWSGNWDWVI